MKLALALLVSLSLFAQAPVPPSKDLPKVSPEAAKLLWKSIAQEKAAMQMARDADETRRKAADLLNADCKSSWGQQPDGEPVCVAPPVKGK